MIEATPRIGRIRSFSRANGYGFVREAASGREFFVHATGLVAPHLEHVAGTKVEFILSKDPSGKLRALNVKRID
jgi:cold shock CspA family protein